MTFLRFSTMNTCSLKILKKSVTVNFYSTIRDEKLSINKNAGTGCKENRFYFKPV